MLAVGRRCWRRWRSSLLPPAPGVGGGQTDDLGLLGLRHQDPGVVLVRLRAKLASCRQQHRGSVRASSVHGSVGVELGSGRGCGLGSSVLGNIMVLLGQVRLGRTYQAIIYSRCSHTTHLLRCEEKMIHLGVSSLLFFSYSIMLLLIIT